jgi:hypothetical protein
MHVITVADSHNELIFLHPRQDPATAQYKKKTRLIVRDVHGVASAIAIGARD